VASSLTTPPSQRPLLDVHLQRPLQPHISPLTLPRTSSGTSLVVPFTPGTARNVLAPWLSLWSPLLPPDLAASRSYTTRSTVTCVLISGSGE
jgi:hypothetical protein